MEKVSWLDKMNIREKIIFLVVLVGSLIVSVSLCVALKNIKNVLLTASENKSKNIVEMVYSVIEDYNVEVQKGGVSLEQAKKEVIKEVNGMRYDGKNYIWITDYNDNMLAHPTLEGKNIANVADKNGIRFFHDGVVLAKEHGDGNVKYHWTKPGIDSSKVFPKSSYFKSFPQWNWVIATGCYIDEIDTIAISVFFQVLAFTLMTLIILVAIAIFTIVKAIMDSMSKVASDLGDSSKQVESASSELNAASQKLAEGSTEQAASIQETSSTLEETSSMVEQNRINTSKAANLAKESKDYAQKSSLGMKNMMKAMDEINNSSAEIEKIIKVIDEIAFQTNILSLNAAVEAARAGDVGKGFAVVAEEVRNLAQRSAQAAKDTTEIIQTNISKAQAGEEIVKGVQESIDSIEEQSKKVSELLDEIEVATSEQAQGVGQINKAVSQIETVIHSNAQTAEESASASQSLYAQTLNLNEIIKRLENIVCGAARSRLDIKDVSLVKKQVNKTKVNVAKPKSKKVENVRTVEKEAHKVEVKKIEQKPSKELSPKDIIPLGDDIDNF